MLTASVHTDALSSRLYSRACFEHALNLTHLRALKPSAQVCALGGELLAHCTAARGRS